MLCYISIFKLVLILAGDIDLFQQSGWNSFDNVIDLLISSKATNRSSSKQVYAT
jgi:hypothetical protein